MGLTGRDVTAIGGRLAVALSPIAGLVALQIWLVDAPVTRGGTFAGGLLHGVLTPLNAVRWVLGDAGVKDFASGWGYELGYLGGAVGLLVAWQTLLQVVANRAVGRPHPFDRPALAASAAVVVALLACGGAFGQGITPPIGPVPPLWNVVPGAWRQGGMAIVGLLVGASASVGALALLLSPASVRRTRA